MAQGAFFKKICSMEDIGLKLDKECRYPEVPKYFKKKYGMSFHGSVLLLNTGNFPGKRKMRSLEIDEEIATLGIPWISPAYYGSAVKQKIKKYYGKDIFKSSDPVEKSRCECCGGLLT